MARIPSVERLKGYLEEWYINNPKMHSGDMSTAIRDLLTDLHHVGDDYGVNIHARVLDAAEVYEEEDNPPVRLGICQWFSYCKHDAITTRNHPILGLIPVCEKCESLFKVD